MYTVIYFYLYFLANAEGEQKIVQTFKGGERKSSFGTSCATPHSEIQGKYASYKVSST